MIAGLYSTTFSSDDFTTKIHKPRGGVGINKETDTNPSNQSNKRKGELEMKKIIALLLSLVLVLTFLAGCATQTAAPEEPAAPAQEEAAPVEEEAAVEEAAAEEVMAPGEVIVAIGADPGDLAPFVGMSYGRIKVLHTLYEYLFDANQETGELDPYIAQSYEMTGDKSLVVTLFENVYDSAGNHIMAADAAWSYNTAMEMGNLRPLGDLESVTATGDFTVEFVLKEVPGKGVVDKVITEAPIVSQAAYEASSDQFATAPITTGPYILTEYVPGSSITFEKRNDYWQTDLSMGPKYNQANIDKITMQIITEPAQHAIALETGSADISDSVSSADAGNFVGKEGFSLFTFQDNLTQALIFNGSAGNVFTNKDLRQAVAYAIDTKAMCAAVSPGGCTSSVTIGNSNFNGYMDKWESEDYYGFDLAKAQELYAASGQADGLSVNLLAQNDPRSGLMAQVIQSQLKELGMNVEINQVEASVFNQMKADPTAFDLLIDATAGGDFIFSPSQLIFDQNRNNGTTGGFVKDDELQALLDAAATEFTPEAIDAFHIYQKDQVYAYGLLSTHNVIVAVDGVTKVELDSRGQLVPGVCEYAEGFTH
jgi:ABC-type transport system substrate-binding protein